MPIDVASLIKPAATASSYLKLCIFGESGCGKTTLAAAAPKPLLIDTERGATTLVKNSELASTPVVEAKSLQEVLEICEYLRGPGGAEYETIIVDTMSELTSLFLDSLIKDSGRTDAYAVGDGMYEKRNQQGRRVLSDLLSLSKHIILLCHVDTVKINEIQTRVPRTTPKIRESIFSLMDVVGYMYLDTERAPTAVNPGATIKTRKIQTLRTMFVEAKNRLDVPDYIENPTINVFFDAHFANKAKSPELLAPVVQLSTALTAAKAIHPTNFTSNIGLKI